MLDINFIAQATSEAALDSTSVGGTVVVILVSLAFGFITGLCIWGEDRKRFAEADKMNQGLQDQIDDARKAQA